MAMYLMFYPLQAFFAVVFYGPAGFVSTWFTVLQQSGLVSTFLVTFLLMPEIQKVAFDAVLCKECADDVVLIGKLRRVANVPFLVRWGRMIWALPNMLVLPFTFIRAIIMFLLNSIPVIGPIMVVVIQAPTNGLRAHSRYFTLKDYDKKQIKQVYKKNRGQYMGFGIVANFLETIPLFSVLFMFTNTIGAALWVIDIEQKLKQTSENKLIEASEELDIDAYPIENIDEKETKEDTQNEYTTELKQISSHVPSNEVK